MARTHRLPHTHHPQQFALRRLAYWSFIVVSSVLVGFFVVGYAARYLHPSYAWGGEIIAVGLPYITILLVGLAGVAWAIRHWTLVGVLSVVLLLAALRFLPPTIVPVTPAADDSDLTIMAFNVTHWSDDVMGKKERLEQVVVENEPTLLAFQEAPVVYTADGQQLEQTANFLEGVMDSLNYQVPAMQMISDARSKRYRRNDQTVLSRFPLKEQENIFLAEDGGTGGRSSAVRVVFEWQGRDVVLYNVHLRSFGRDKPWEEGLRGPLSLDFWYRYLRQYRDAFRDRANEAEVLRQRIEEEELPVLIVGDFNSTPHSWVFWNLMHDKQDAFKRAGTGWGGTYHSTLPLVRIDHVLVGPEWQITEARVLQTGADLSEHRPLVVSLRWQDD